jgi:thiamine biosynthesis protein ThiC
LQITRPDGTKVMLHNIYRKQIDVNDIGKHKRLKSNAVVGRNAQQNKIGAE